jgi:hypothetical protein
MSWQLVGRPRNGAILVCVEKYTDNLLRFRLYELSNYYR